ncbi:hypothetical protein COLO4_15740 [Corchorus olitorius]|uniref:Uncharacterized protein n=1 Tax=Corchorus olitorius TaxID=93759 RepID=A0A1R3JLD4_9ROSI|nr:hypothetical protein COLO4_15740 [Corchorus olitorius]
MGKNPMAAGLPLGVRKGAWTEEEDLLLKKYIEKHGEGKWHQVPSKAGLNRCRKSCRLRWLNYLKPNIKRGDFDDDEVDLIIRLHKLLVVDEQQYQASEEADGWFNYGYNPSGMEEAEDELMLKSSSEEIILGEMSKVVEEAAAGNQSCWDQLFCDVQLWN